MPAWQAALGDNGIAAVTEYVLSLSDQPHDEDLAARGEAQYQASCAFCHGKDGKGYWASPDFANARLTDTELARTGAPNLTDNVWLYDLPALDLRADIALTLRNGRAGNMPAWKDVLGEEKVHLVTGYIYSLSR